MTDEARRFIDFKGLVNGVLIAVATYFAVNLSQRPEATADKLASHETRIAVMEARIGEMREDVKAIREAVTRGRR